MMKVVKAVGLRHIAVFINQKASRVHFADNDNAIRWQRAGDLGAICGPRRGYRTGRLCADIRDGDTDCRPTAHLREAPLTHEIVLAAHELPLPHQDPADRFLAATAGTLDLTLVTADDRLLGLGKIATLANH
jgi:hypothetical protein